MTKKIFLQLFFYACGLLFLFGHASNVSALAVGDRGIMPAHPDPSVKYSDSWFIYTINPGETKEDAALISNNSDETLTFLLNAVDAETTSDGAFAPLENNAPKQDVGSWVKMSQSSVVVPAHKEIEVPFTVTVPKDNIDVGEHFGAIVMQEVKEQTPHGQGVGIGIVTRVGVRMYVTVPGEIHKNLDFTQINYKFYSRLTFQKEIIWWDRVLEYLGFKPAVQYSLVLHNGGNVRVEPFGQIRIKNIFGRTIKTYDRMSFGMVMPGKDITIPVNWNDPPFIGKFRTTVDVSYEGGGPLTKTIDVWIIPYRLLILIGLMIALAVIFRLLFQLIVVKEQSKMRVHTVVAGDTIDSIASQYQANWKYLARVNKLKPPYKLEPGQQIMIPRENLWLSFFKSFFRSKRNVIILAIILVAIGGAIYYRHWWKEEKVRQRVEQMNMQQQEEDARLRVVLGEQIKVDNQRKADLHTIQAALEAYKAKEGHYPIVAGRSKTTDENNVFQVELKDKGYLEMVPLDPKHPNYYYGYETDEQGATYKITSILENRSDQEGVMIDDFVFYRLTPESK